MAKSKSAQAKAHAKVRELLQKPYSTLSQDDFDFLLDYIDSEIDAFVKDEAEHFYIRVEGKPREFKEVGNIKYKLAISGRSVAGINDNLTAINNTVQELERVHQYFGTDTDTSQFTKEKIAYLKVARNNPLAILVQSIKDRDPSLTPDGVLEKVLDDMTCLLGNLPDDPLFEHRRKWLSSGPPKHLRAAKR